MGSHEEAVAHLERFHNTMAKFVAMAIILPSGDKPSNDAIRNGTVSFVELPGGKFLITNHHVWARYEIERERSEAAVLAVCGRKEAGVQPVVVSDSTLVDSDESLDLAVLSYEHTDIIEGIGKRFFRAEWPLEVPEPGDTVFFVGYPGVHRDMSEKGLEVRSAFFGPTVIGVSLRNIICDFSDPGLEVFRHDPNLGSIGPIGGVSGAALYMVDHKQGKPALAGFVHMASDTNDPRDSSIIAARADLLNGDGTIRRTESNSAHDGRRHR